MCHRSPTRRPRPIARKRPPERGTCVGPYRASRGQFSYTGGAALTKLGERLGARCAAPLNGSVDPSAHFPVGPVDVYRSDLSYLGTYAGDRQRGAEELFVNVARRMPNRRFVLAGAQYPPTFPWTANTYFMWHLAPAEHPAF